MAGLPPIQQADLAHFQTVADMLHKGAGMVQGMPEIASMLQIGAQNIESACDVIKAQEKLLLSMHELASEIGKDDDAD